MPPRSFQVLPNYIQQVKSAFDKKYSRQADLARDANITVNTVAKFLSGKPVTIHNFCQLCDRLELNWKAIARVDKPDDKMANLSAVEEENTTTNCGNFLGREKAIEELKDLVKQGSKVLLIYGEGGVGKSSICWLFLATQGCDLILDLWMAKETKNITAAKSVVEEWLRRHFNDKPNGDFAAMLERLAQKLANKTKKVGVIIDNLEPALDKDGKFIADRQDYIELLKVLSHPDSNCITTISSREKLKEPAVNLEAYRLQGLGIETWQKFFQNRHIKTDSAALQDIHAAYAGNTKAMHIISGTIQIDWEGDLDAYWRSNEHNLLVERDLEDLVITQFNRLETLDPQAYKLLCRLGCYRYQDVRSVSLNGIMYLLWDVPEEERLRVVRSLCDRSLLDCFMDEYWLHPVIRAEAIAQIISSEEWVLANRKAAEFWTESVATIETVEDAIKAIEAYYHCIEIGDFQLAAELILQERKTKLSYLGEEESLNDSFDRLGLYQYMISALNFLIDKIDRGDILSILYGCLGRHYLRTGNIQKSLAVYQHAREIAIKSQDKYPKTDRNNKFSRKIIQQSLANLLSMSWCKIILGETEEAIAYYEQVKLFAERSDLRLFVAFSYFGLARLYSDSKYQKHDRAKAYALLESGYQTYREISVKMLTAWSEVYSFLISGMVYRNLGENEKAIEMFQETLKCANESKSTQVKGQAMSELAVVYRQINDFEKAIDNHEQAREIFQRLGAESDLAGLYYEMGLTYQKMGDLENSDRSFQAAISLFEDIVAPKQVEKVKMAMVNRK